MTNTAQAFLLIRQGVEQMIKEMEPSELEFCIVLTLVPTFSCPVDVAVIEQDYNGRWSTAAQNALGDKPEYSGSRFFKRARCVVEFTHIFSDATVRDEFYNSEAYAEIKRDLASEFDILADYTLDGVSGHKDIGRQ